MDNSVDIEKIMENIREEIVKSGKDKQPLSFKDVESTERNGDLDEAIDYIRSSERSPDSSFFR